MLSVVSVGAIETAGTVRGSLPRYAALSRYVDRSRTCHRIGRIKLHVTAESSTAIDSDAPISYCLSLFVVTVTDDFVANGTFTTSRAGCADEDSWSSLAGNDTVRLASVAARVTGNSQLQLTSSRRVPPFLTQPLPQLAFAIWVGVDGLGLLDSLHVAQIILASTGSQIDCSSAACSVAGVRIRTLRAVEPSATTKDASIAALRSRVNLSAATIANHTTIASFLTMEYWKIGVPSLSAPSEASAILQGNSLTAAEERFLPAMPPLRMLLVNSTVNMAADDCSSLNGGLFSRRRTSVVSPVRTTGVEATHADEVEGGADAYAAKPCTWRSIKTRCPAERRRQTSPSAPLLPSSPADAS